MSKIDRLSIQGVRSFGPNHKEAIVFNTPLTLIVGYNGSGKTTIIECLKYATTGELPPNSKGGAFIHDPKLAGEREVQAQVKLKFKTPPDCEHIVTRNLQLTIKKSQRTMKTLESSLVNVTNGERVTISSKHGVMNEMIPEKLGVGHAILDAVIFCHQDESLWPMNEPSQLKKRFDEIFEAQKYTKAIDNLKVMRKNYGEKLKQYKIIEAQEKLNKEKADRCEKRSFELHDQVESLRTKAHELKPQLAELETNAKAKHEQASSFRHIVQDLANKRSQLDFRQTAAEELKESIKELDESDEWLQETLGQFEEKVARYETEYEENKTRYADLQKELAQTRRSLGDKQSERGRHESDKDKYERQLKLRVDFIHQAANLHGVRGFEGNLGDRQVQQFSERIQKLLAEKKRELELVHNENENDVDKQTAAIQELEGRKSAKTQDRAFAKQRIGNIENKSSALQAQINSLDVDENAKAVLDAECKDVEERLQKAAHDFQSSEFETKIRHETDELVKFEAEGDRLGRELVECTRLADDRAQLGLRKKELAEKKRTLDMLTNTWSDKISSTVVSVWKPESVEKEFQAALKKRTQALEDATRKRDNEDQQLKQVQFSLANAQTKLTNQNQQQEQCGKAVCQALKEVNPDTTPAVGSLTKEIEDLEEKILSYEKDISLFDEMKSFYLKCQKTMNKNNKCLLCDRIFGEAGERSRLAQRIKEGLDDKEKEKTKDELEACEEQLGRLRAVRPQFDTHERLRAEKSGLEGEIQTLKKRDDDFLRRLEELDQIVREKQEQRQDLESMTKTVSAIARTFQETVEAEAQVERSVSQQQSNAMSRTPEEIRELQEVCGDQMRSAKNRLNLLQAERQRTRDVISSLELEKSRLTNKVKDAARQLERKRDFQTQIQGHKDDLNHQKEIIQRADSELAKIDPEIVKARAIRDDVLERGRAKEKKVADERDGLAGSVNELKMIEGNIRDYLDRGGPSLLAATARAIDSLQQAEARVDKDMQELAARTNRLKEEISNSDQQKKNVSDNLNYRKNLREIDHLRRDVAALEARNATEDYERLEYEAKAFEAEHNRMNAERASILATMTTVDVELKRLMEEHETDYKHAGRKYREAHIKVETTRAAIEDLGRYSMALDSAIMRYHTLKMEEVNRIAGELWHKTYQGTDIDTILIRSDNESTAGRRSYNYRVCMVKQDTEMDMRGRCSAGQKVLACIIIRLALAESFGTNCGLIALDEPTTNLDSDNIKSLAESLHNIIQIRQAQSNFQLIVITHDEEFLRHMRCSDFCDSYFRVRRDTNQKSVISQESINKVL